MTRSLRNKFIAKAGEDGIFAASKAACEWLARKRDAKFERRAVALAESYLVKNGWLNKFPCDEFGPTPWFTYPAIAFLKDIVSPKMRVFEYGSGYSTMFFNARAKEVVSVEHDPIWAQQLLRDNKAYDIRIRPLGYEQKADYSSVLYRFRAQGFGEPTLGDREQDIRHGLVNSEFLGYATELLTMPKGHFDLVVVDGMARLLSGFIAAESVADDGFIILDNSDRWQYNSLQAFLIEQGYGRIDFWGPGPINTYAWCTSFFSRRLAIDNQTPERPRGSGELGY